MYIIFITYALRNYLDLRACMMYNTDLYIKVANPLLDRKNK